MLKRFKEHDTEIVHSDNVALISLEDPSTLALSICSAILLGISLTIKLSKVCAGFNEIEFPGHIVSEVRSNQT